MVRLSSYFWLFLLLSAAASMSVSKNPIDQKTDYKEAKGVTVNFNVDSRRFGTDTCDGSCDAFEGRLSAIEDILQRIEGKLDNVTVDKDSLPQTPVAQTCKVLLQKGFTNNGVYTIDPKDGHGPFDVYCDMETSDGGWEVFQRRKDGSIDFFREWNDYKNGFGDLNGEFWLGLDKIHRLTQRSSQVLRIDMADFDGNSRYATYGTFSVGDEASGYVLTNAHYSGDAGDSFSYQNKQKFSTKDRDNDKDGVNCAQTFKGAWWYSTCHYSNLNGFYHNGTHKSYGDGVNWRVWKGYHYSLKFTEMKIRPK